MHAIAGVSNLSNFLRAHIHNVTSNWYVIKHRELDQAVVYDVALRNYQNWF